MTVYQLWEELMVLLAQHPSARDRGVYVIDDHDFTVKYLYALEFDEDGDLQLEIATK